MTHVQHLRICQFLNAIIANIGDSRSYKTDISQIYSDGCGFFRGDYSYNFEKFGLKKWIATCYKNLSRDLRQNMKSNEKRPA